MKVAAVLATLAAVASAYKLDVNGMAADGNPCADCAKYCTDGSNGAALGAACLIVKCGIQCIIA